MTDEGREAVVIDRGPEVDSAHRYYVTAGGFGASSWSPEAALAQVRRMQATARHAEAGAL